MLSFREQLGMLKEQARNGNTFEKDAKSVANEFLQKALEQLSQKDHCIRRNIQGIGVRLIPHTYTSVCIDYLDHRNFFSFTLVTMDYEDKEYALKVFKAIQDILSEESFQIDHALPYSFDVSL